MMDIIEIRSVDELFDYLDARRGNEPYLAVNATIGGEATFVERLRAADALVTGFGGVLHPGNPWTGIVAKMPTELREENRAQTGALFDRPNLSADREFALLFADVARMVRSSFTREDIRRAAVDASPPRAGAREFVGSFARDRRCAVSFGIWDYVAHWCRVHSMPVIEIAALALSFGEDEAESVVGCDWQTAVIGNNKGLAAGAFCASIGADPARVVAVGDSPTDLTMIHPGNVGIFLLPHADDDALRRQFRRDGITRMWPRCSAALVADTLQPLADIRLGS